MERRKTIAAALAAMAFSFLLRSASSLAVAGTTTKNNMDGDGQFLPAFEFTSIPRDLTWEFRSPPVPAESEKDLIQSGVLVQRGEFGRLSGSRVDEIHAASQKSNMTLAQVFNLRKQTLVTNTLFSGQKLKKQGARLSSALEAGTSILDLSKQVDQPPVSILRAVLDHRIRLLYPTLLDFHVKGIVKTIIYDELTGVHLNDFLSQHEQDQLNIAKENDVVSYDDPLSNGQQEASLAWEQSLYGYLDSNNVNYMTEEDLRMSGATRTPDCLLLDDCTIDGQPVRWIDCKNYYGSSSSKHFQKKARKQIHKYESVFEAPGAIIYKLGFSESLKAGFPGTLLLDRGSLSDDKQ
jgi:hypothetical protein